MRKKILFIIWLVLLSGSFVLNGGYSFSTASAKTKFSKAKSKKKRKNPKKKKPTKKKSSDNSSSSGPVEPLESGQYTLYMDDINTVKVILKEESKGEVLYGVGFEGEGLYNDISSYYKVKVLIDPTEEIAGIDANAFDVLSEVINMCHKNILMFNADPDKYLLVVNSRDFIIIAKRNFWNITYRLDKHYVDSSVMCSLVKR